MSTFVDENTNYLVN